jgi:hypothetical protein
MPFLRLLVAPFESLRMENEVVEATHIANDSPHVTPMLLKRLLVASFASLRMEIEVVDAAHMIMRNFLPNCGKTSKNGPSTAGNKNG